MARFESRFPGLEEEVTAHLLPIIEEDPVGEAYGKYGQATQPFRFEPVASFQDRLATGSHELEPGLEGYQPSNSEDLSDWEVFSLNSDSNSELYPNFDL
jgi:hypothetical protein